MVKYAKVLEKAQFGEETVPGTTVAANRAAPNLKVGIVPDGDPNEEYIPSGGLVPSDQTDSVEWGSGNYEVPHTFVEQIYINDSTYKKVTATGAGTAKTRTWTPSVNAADVRSTYTFQKGQAGSIIQYPMGVFNSQSFSIQKRGRSMVTGELMSQEGTPGTALTATPTVISSRPISNRSWNLFTGTSMSNLQSGGSALITGWKLDYAYGPVLDSEFFIGSAEPSFDDLGIIVPNNSVKLILPKNASGSDFAEHLTLAKKRAGTMIWLRAQAFGNVVEAGTPDTLEESTIDMVLKVRKVPTETELNVYAGLEWELGFYNDPAVTKFMEWKIVSALATK